MCVIIVKQKGVSLPSANELQAAWAHNPHGGGFVCSNGYYWRGMSFKEFYKEFKSHVTVKDACIIHFRFATHGSHKIENCHPFYKDGVYFAHNGILDIQTSNDMTDSETAFRDILLPAIKYYGIHSDTFKTIVANMIGWSRFAFMIDGRITIFGNWIEDTKGLLWSNLNHISVFGRYDYKRSACAEAL